MKKGDLRAAQGKVQKRERLVKMRGWLVKKGDLRAAQ